MKTDKAYVIPVKGMGIGLHQYDFHIDGTFFATRESSPVEMCDLDVTVAADKRENMLLLTFDILGVVDTACDRCLADIKLPISGQYPLIVKLEEAELKEDDEVLILHPETPELDLADVLYEFICLSVPLVRTYDCESEPDPPCDERVIDILDEEESGSSPDDEVNPIWDDLKKKLSS